MSYLLSYGLSLVCQESTGCCPNNFLAQIKHGICIENHKYQQLLA
jgi:hypothetical protein